MNYPSSATKDMMIGHGVLLRHIIDFLINNIEGTLCMKCLTFTLTPEYCRLNERLEGGVIRVVHIKERPRRGLFSNSSEDPGRFSRVFRVIRTSSRRTATAGRFSSGGRRGQTGPRRRIRQGFSRYCRESKQTVSAFVRVPSASRQRARFQLRVRRGYADPEDGRHRSVEEYFLTRNSTGPSGTAIEMPKAARCPSNMIRRLRQ
jgi:hypothetical protein